MKCPQCGFENFDNASRCLGCKTGLAEEEQPPPPPSPLSNQDLDELQLGTPAVFEQIRMFQVIDQAFSIYREHLVPFFLITLVVFLPPFLLMIFVSSQHDISKMDSGPATLLAIAGRLCEFLSLLLASAAMTFGVLQHLRNTPFTPGECGSVSRSLFQWAESPSCNSSP